MNLKPQAISCSIMADCYDLKKIVTPTEITPSDVRLPSPCQANLPLVQRTSTGCGSITSKYSTLESRTVDDKTRTSPCPTGPAAEGRRKSVPGSLSLKAGNGGLGGRELKAAGGRGGRNGLQSILACVSSERAKERAVLKLVCDGMGLLHDNEHRFWVNLFEKHFSNSPEDWCKDDMLFYVRKQSLRSEDLTLPRIEAPSVEVHRKSSQIRPMMGDVEFDWEESTYLNLILQHFEYDVTCAVCTRAGEKQLQILSKFTQKVYASPSKRNMGSKGTEEEMTYPNIFFTIDNFEEVFRDQVVREGEMVCVELVARERHGGFEGVLFLGSIRYEALKRVYDTRASLTHRVVHRMSLGGWFRDQKRVEFVRMRGPNNKGHAEMAVGRVKGSSPATPGLTPSGERFPLDDFKECAPTQQRRMSDPSTGWNYFLRGGGSISAGKRGVGRQTRSDSEDVEGSLADGAAEGTTRGTNEDEFDEGEMSHSTGFLGSSLAQSWSWFSRRANGVALHSFLTYVTLPSNRIVAGQ